MGARLAKLRQVSRTPTATIQNVDKVLEEKIVSPRHPSTVKAFDDLVKANPQFEESAKQRHENLNKMLNSVRVDSTGAAPSEVLKTGKRARKLNVIPDGKLSFDRINDLFINKKIAPEEWTDKKIAEHYMLDPKVAQNLVKYFGSFYIYKKEKDGLVVGDRPKFFESAPTPKELK